MSVKRLYDRALKRYLANYPLVVQKGPFQGMKYINDCGTNVLPKVIGWYESELHEIVGDCLTRKYSSLINIGCAEGFYSVGFAYKNPNLSVHALDIDSDSIKRCQELAALNSVSDRLHTYKESSLRLLSTILDSNSLILCDVEGAEIEYLQPKLLPKLSSCDVLVELHEWKHEKLADIILSRMSETHNFTFINQTEKSVHDWTILEQLNGISDSSKAFILQGLRDPQQRWLFLEQKSVSASKDFESARSSDGE